ncbi:Uncharacterised protein [Vibrio cholerae]|nr:Uncharacterised protein [Vibrio cholerae]
MAACWDRQWTAHSVFQIIATVRVEGELTFCRLNAFNPFHRQSHFHHVRA